MTVLLQVAVMMQSILWWGLAIRYMPQRIDR